MRSSNDARWPAGTGVWLTVTDNGEPGAGRDTQQTYVGGFGNEVNPQVCTVPLQPGEAAQAPLTAGDFVVHDEQP